MTTCPIVTKDVSSLKRISEGNNYVNVECARRQTVPEPMYNIPLYRRQQFAGLALKHEYSYFTAI